MNEIDEGEEKEGRIAKNEITVIGCDRENEWRDGEVAVKQVY